MKGDENDDKWGNAKQLIHLRREIVGGTAQSPCRIRAVLGESKVRNFDVAIKTEKDVLWFEIAINDI